jgi:hypothetical protein
MLRQRLHLEGSSIAAGVTRFLAAVVGAAFVYYGAMLVMLALKVSPETVNDLCGYRTAFDYLAGLEAGDISSSDRLVVAIVALGVALIALLLLWRGLPRPHLARHGIELAETDLGTTDVQPRALERAVEHAALGHAAVVGARARYDDGGIALLITAGRASAVVGTLAEVRDLAHRSLETHQLKLEHVDVTLAGYKGNNGRDLK